MTINPQGPPRDVVSQLRMLRDAMSRTLQGQDVIDEAITEIERLREKASEASDGGQYWKGYHQAQFDIRQALGLED